MTGGCAHHGLICRRDSDAEAKLHQPAGLAEGIELGQRDTALSIAHSLLPLLKDDAAIAAATGLSTTEIARLRRGG